MMGEGRGGCRRAGFRRWAHHGMHHGPHSGYHHLPSHAPPRGKNQDYCADLVESQITLADRAVLFPGQVVVKTWTLRNVGTKPWPENVTVEYVGRPFNALINGVKFPVKGGVQIGEEVEVSAVITAPKEGGRYGSSWRLSLPDGTRFGQMLRCRVAVYDENGAIPSNEKRKCVNASTKKQAKKAKKLAKKQAKLESRREKLEKQRDKIAAKLAAVSSRLEESDDEEIQEFEDMEMPPLSPAAVVHDSTVFFVGGEPECLPEIASTEDEEPSAPAMVEFPIEGPAPVEVYKYQAALDTLKSMGFTNEESLKALLNANGGDVMRVINGSL